jgi:branched-chain amino acid aminotransferase
MAAHPAYLWLNGQQTAWENATLHISEVGWSTVGGVFEGIRAYWNADENELYVFRLREHLERLARSMKLVRLPLAYSVDELTRAIVDLLRVNNTREDSYIFPMGFTAESYKHRYDLPQESSSLVIHTKPMPSHLQEEVKYTGRIASWRRISEDVMPPRVKNLSNYRNGQLARMEAVADGYDTSLLLNAQGKVAEAPGACVMLIRDGKLITPDLTSGVLESITRDALLVMARDLGIPVEERSVDRTEFYVGDEAFVCGTAAEVTPLVELDHYQIGDGGIGPITRKLRAAYEAALRGTDGSYPEWRTPVGVAALSTAG